MPFTAIQGFDCCSFPTVCAFAAPSIQAIREWMRLTTGLTSQHRVGPLSPAEVRAELASGRPVIVGYQGSFAGHVVVIAGIHDDDALLILDPYFGVFDRVPFRRAMTYAGSMTWAHTIHGIR